METSTEVRVTSLAKDQIFEYEGKLFIVYRDYRMKRDKGAVFCIPVIPEGKNGKDGYKVGIFTMVKPIVLISTEPALDVRK